MQPRPGWSKLGRLAAPGCGLYQSGYLYDASAYSITAKPYLIAQVGGRILQMRVDTDNSVVDLSTVSGLTMPAGVEQGYMCQGEQFLVMQAGDYATLPLFWDGVAVRRSNGINDTVALPGATFNVPAIGAPVLVALTSPYAGSVNQQFTINGFHYIQVDPNQRYNVAGFSNNNGDALKPFTAVTNSIWVDTPDAKFLIDFNDTLGAAPLPAFGPTVCFCESTGLNVAPYINIHIPGLTGVVTAQFTANPLAALGANQIYLLNIDDPNVGAPIALPANVASELPSAGPMDYYMGRLWYAQNLTYSAGDIVGGPSGTGPYDYRDSILKVTENPLAVGGDGFSVPSSSGNITSLTHPANMDAALGEGRLTIFTAKSVYQCSVPITRTDWIGASDNNGPLQSVVQKTNGTIAERSVLSHNGDIFYRASDGIRTLITAMRYFGQWANPPISSNVDRALRFDTDALMQFASAVSFNNRILQTCFPIQTDVGVAYRGLLSLDFDLISTLQEQLPPAWEGSWEGLNILQLFVGQYSGGQRCFAVVAAEDGGIDVWEVSKEAKLDGENRIEWAFETPAWTNGKEFELKRLKAGELWLDRITGTVGVKVEFRPDGDNCWYFWHRVKFCSQSDTCEDDETPICYPEQGYEVLGEGYRYTLMLPEPPKVDHSNQQTTRPLDRAFQFQVRVTIKGFCRVRGLLVYTWPVERPAYEGLV